MEIAIGLEVDKVIEKYVHGKGGVSQYLLWPRPWRMMIERKKFAHHYLIDQISLLKLHIDFNMFVYVGILNKDIVTAG